MSSPSTSGGTSHTHPTSVTTPDGYQTSKNAWRPSYHLMPRSGWMNDPCAPGYDPATGTYHISFQWNPNGPDWGDICWGTAVSTDMISWKIQENPILLPDTHYDAKGVFTGCFLKGHDGSFNYIYTSVSALPIHHTIPHVRGCETLSMATSLDDGRTWEKNTRNPILPGEPPGLDVTGWRDPFCARWENMSTVLGMDSQTLLGIISGGIRDVTPTSFLYKVNAEDPSDWSYLGPLANFGLNLRPSRWSGDLGRNWEVTNFLPIKDPETPSLNHDFLIMGTEGCLEDANGSPVTAGPSRPSRGQLWMSGTIQKQPGSGVAQISYDYGGHLDHGCMYAANSFFDPKIQKHVVWGWITEEDLCDELRHQQGWSGMLSMPRQIEMQTLKNVVKALSSDLSSITSVKLSPEGGDRFTVQTLSTQPYQPLIESLRVGSRLSKLAPSILSSHGNDVAYPPEASQSKQWELQCSFKLSTSCTAVGVSIGHTQDFGESTTMTFDPRLETFTISRPSLGLPHASLLINSSPESAPHTLFTTHNPETNELTTETLDIRAWRDNSVLEVFVNGRTAISTRLYAGRDTFGIRFFATSDIENAGISGHTRLESAMLWDGIGV
ncbi:glycosyl hydrolase [Penicillium brevicompactum]|uniref:glycosyl hydrolase n=1 Tax=Penicillium brevicompactum TaxID=5074 RepID=UPI00254186AC|nr:glycosyl hydrolase [Penicillium brevicompactum]KAJ5343760.1 glycosyl hydrolase [Penicillium brevicompactum]